MFYFYPLWVLLFCNVIGSRLRLLWLSGACFWLRLKLHPSASSCAFAHFWGDLACIFTRFGRDVAWLRLYIVVGLCIGFGGNTFLGNNPIKSFFLIVYQIDRHTIFDFPPNQFSSNGSLDFRTNNRSNWSCSILF